MSKMLRVGDKENLVISLKKGQRERFQEFSYSLGLSMSYCMRNLINAIIKQDKRIAKIIFTAGAIGEKEPFNITLKKGKRSEFHDAACSMGVSMNHCIRNIVQAAINGNRDVKRIILEG